MITEKALQLNDVAGRLSAVQNEAQTVKQLNSRREELDKAKKALQVSLERWHAFREAGLITPVTDGELKNIRAHLKKLIHDAVEDPGVLIASSRFSTVLRNLFFVQERLETSMQEAWEDYAQSVKPTILPVVLQSLAVQPQKRHLVQQWQELSAQYDVLRFSTLPNRKTIAEMRLLAAQFKTLNHQLQSDALPPAVAHFFEQLQMGQAKLSDINDDVWQWLQAHNVLEQFVISASKH